MRFWFHYNKIASRKRGKPVITLHFKNQCVLVDNFVCNVKTYGRTRKTQPHFVVVGDAKDIEIKNGIANIT